MYSAACIAHEFVNKGIKTGNFVTQMKLQKMVFFAHGYHLAKYEVPLINEKFEAWKFGPVVPAIYQAFKTFGSRQIYDTTYISYDVSIELCSLDSKALDSVNYTWEITKDLTASSLSNWSHQPDTPWWKAYDPNIDNSPIDNSEIKRYFKKLLTKEPVASV